ncbi:MAG: hypothetical protein WBI74_03420 [Caldicoprobacterales bacterium]|nr:hypothetical protein [Clostridiales bacterium]
MDFLDDLGKKIGETVKVVGDKSQQIVEIGKINIEIGKEEAAVKKLYTKIGEAVYRAHLGEETAENIENLCQEVTQRLQRIEELKEKINELKSQA